MSESSSDEDVNFTPEELVQAVDNAELSFLPEKSREKYIKAYNLFNAWIHSKGAKTFSETIMLSYFIELSKTRQSSTLWSIFSMLKATIKTKNDIHIEKYSKLLAFLKKNSSGHKPKKSKIFTHTNIEQFLNEAPDSEFLATKVSILLDFQFELKVCTYCRSCKKCSSIALQVVLIIGISGACRANELMCLTTKNIEKHSEKLLLVNLTNTTTNIDRNFVIRDEYVKIVEKYQALRPANTPIDRFFLQYRNGKCYRQPMGSTKIGGLPREIATFLGLEDPKQYTGHCFRRTSATLLSDSGADLTTLKRHSGCKSSIETEGHIQDSTENKSEICKGVVGGIPFKLSCPDSCTHPSTSNHFASPAIHLYL